MRKNKTNLIKIKFIQFDFFCSNNLLHFYKALLEMRVPNSVWISFTFANFFHVCKYDIPWKRTYRIFYLLPKQS